MLSGVFFLLSLANAHSWIKDKGLLTATLKQAPVVPPRFAINLDDPPESRWEHIVSRQEFASQGPVIKDYLASNVPSWLLPPLELAMGSIVEVFGSDYADESRSLARGLGLKLGDIVALNLVMQLEHIALNCSNWNNTGPTLPDDPGCTAVDPTQAWCFCKEQMEPPLNGPGMCTSVVAQASNGTMMLGRNLDWNLPKALRKLVVDIDFQRSGRTVFRGTTAVGFVGLMNGMFPGEAAVSIDARYKGGKIPANFFALLVRHATTPAQHLRRAFEAMKPGSGYASIVRILETGKLVDPIYYIVAGVRDGEGVILARDRNRLANRWPLNVKNGSDLDGWFRLATNYDLDHPVPKADDRRTPGLAHMRALGQDKVANSGALIDKVLTRWPTFNHHTDYSAVMSPTTGYYESSVWMDTEVSSKSDLLV